ncbi:MAG: ATP synthase F1 subunit delta [Treponemataceae bacterium]|nr:MAG: ATP synthase F1 subunit delta [Treponemataceae bacterium]
MAKPETNYARALFALTAGSSAAKEMQDYFHDALQMFREILVKKDAGKNLAFFTNPTVHKKDKRAVIRQAIAATDANTVLFKNFLCLLADKERFDLFEKICVEYDNCVDRARKIMLVKIQSAFELDKTQIDAIAQAYKKRLGADKIRVEIKIMPELIGGVRVIAGDLYIDDTIFARTKRLKALLSQVR